MHTALPTSPARPFVSPAPEGSPGWLDLAPHREHLVRYAERRLLDPALAEDLVHDVFEAVMTGRARYAGRSALRSWLVGILKHKIVDLIRERVLVTSLDADRDDDGESVSSWEPECPAPGPHDLAELRQRLARALAGIAALPEPLKRVMELRVLDDADAAHVCRELAISPENLYVRLHRARVQLAH